MSDVSDVILLQDLSSSFGDDLPELQSLIVPLLDTLEEEDPDTLFGIASFIDKPIFPFGGSEDYVYQVDIPLTDDVETIVSTVNNFETAFGDDFPEAQLEALLQASLDSDLGYRDGSNRFILLTTDVKFHIEGDGPAFNSTITQPNNGDDVIDADEDYPSIDQVSSALEDNNITPIFLVTFDVTDSYEDLVADLGRGEVVTLTSDSSNVVDAVRLALAEVSGDVTEVGTDGDDRIVETEGDDVFFGGLGDDTISGGDGDDVLDGGFDDDVLDGGAGEDSLEGGSGLDSLDGGAGSDLIEGGLDGDVLSGSEAADTFAGTLAELDGDVILDFTEEDRILVRGVSFTDESLTVTEGEGILDIDVDLDGEIDATITLEGDFTDVDFVVESESSEDVTNTIISIGEVISDPELGDGGDDIDNGGIIDMGYGEVLDLRTQPVIFTITRDADFNNSVGFYEANADGSVVDELSGTTIAPGEGGYLEAVIANRLDIELNVPNNGEQAEFTAELPGGTIIAPFLVVNGSIAEVADDDTSSDPKVYFTYAEANTDGFDYIRSIGTNQLGFEDFPGGGDLDFDDIVVEFDFV